MKRKQFLASLLTVAASVRAMANPLPDIQEAVGAIHPPYLKPGDLIGIACPAGAITLEEIQPAIRLIQSWGYAVRVGETIGKKDFSFGGTDEERAADFQKMLDDHSVKAILCARGGYGTIRIIDRLDFSIFRSFPKWILGFSDITVLHSHIYRHCGIATIHSKMCNSFPESLEMPGEEERKNSILTIHDCLKGEKISISVFANSRNKLGMGRGKLIGGNLKILETLSGTVSDINTMGAILFLEDTGEYLYNIDRMFWNLNRTGKLKKLSGLIIGGFNIKPDDPGEEFGRDLYDIVLQQTKNFDYPVCFDFPVGHQKNNLPLKCGAHFNIDVGSSMATLSEI